MITLFCIEEAECVSYRLLDKQMSNESSFEGQTSCGSTQDFEQTQISFHQLSRNQDVLCCIGESATPGAPPHKPHTNFIIRVWI